MKRFWTTTAAVEAEGGYRIELDGRPVKTPAKQTLLLPTRGLADALAAEWDAQVETVSPTTMPLTRLANSTIDKVAIQHAAVADMLADYGASDLLCYRAESPQALVDRQATAWDPLLAWAKSTFGIALIVQSGLMPVSQPDDSVSKIRALTHDLDTFGLTAFHELVTISGSWVIGMAAIRESVDVESLWASAIVDELFQAEHWGDDTEATENRAAKHGAFLCGMRFWKLARENKAKTSG